MFDFPYLIYLHHKSVDSTWPDGFDGFVLSGKYHSDTHTNKQK